MPDTPRTRSEMLARFAAARGGLVSNQDLRDFVVSARPGALYDQFSFMGVYKDNATSIMTIPAGGATTWGPTQVTIDAYCLTCEGVLAYFNDGLGWSHLNFKGLKIRKRHKPLPDRFVYVRERVA